MKTALLACASLLALTCHAMFSADFADFAHANNVPVYDVEIVAQIPHSTDSFTQGLLFLDGVLYESTGLYGQSTLCKLDPATGQVLQTVALDSNYFGEGLADWQGELVQLTWQENTALVWRASDLARIKSYHYRGEGWGLTADKQSFIMSDGEPYLYRRSFDDFSLLDSISVTIAGHSLKGLNELEYARGRVYANYLGLDDIAEIDPATGAITAVVDAGSLRDLILEDPLMSPMNGIAYDPASDEFYLTGKLWPKIFRVRFVTSFGK
jgi:glutamine cyclotransferase